MSSDVQTVENGCVLLFPNHLINITGACILGIRRRKSFYRIEQDFVVEHNDIHMLDTVYYYPEDLWIEDKIYSVLINFKYPQSFNHPDDYCKYLVNNHLKNIQNKLSNVLDPNCDVKNIIDIITKFYMDTDRVEIKIICNRERPHVSAVQYQQSYSCIPLRYKGYNYYFYIPNPDQNSSYYLGIFVNNKLISKSQKIVINDLYITYEHPNIIPQSLTHSYESDDEYFREEENSSIEDEYYMDDYP